MKVLHTTICEKIDRAASNVAQVQKSASVIKKSEQDLELKKKQVSKAIESGKLLRNINEMMVKNSYIHNRNNLFLHKNDLPVYISHKTSIF